MDHIIEIEDLLKKPFEIIKENTIEISSHDGAIPDEIPSQSVDNQQPNQQLNSLLSS